jgi:hypothetical protein
LDAELRTQGLTLAVPTTPLDQIAYYPEMTAAIEIEPAERNVGLAVPCTAWDIMLKPIRTAIFPRQRYHVEDVAILSDPYLLPDESVLAAQWKAPTCEEFPTRSFDIELLHIQTDGRVKIVASDVSPGWVFDPRVLTYTSLPSYGKSNMYAVSPDGHYVAWVKQGRPSSVMVSDLETGQYTTLLELNQDDGNASVVLFRIVE